MVSDVAKAAVLLLSTQREPCTSPYAYLSVNCIVGLQVRHVLDAHTSPVPAILEIPSKDSPYDPSKDSILRSAALRCFS